MQYLYGAAVQGIQSFIFQTNELKDIVGASELVEMICTRLFEKYKANGTIVVNAAGNIKCVYSNVEECKKAVMYFPKEVMEKAPGITISQAVVKYSDEGKFEQAVDKLEQRLHVQRNKPVRSLIRGDIAMMRSRTTGLPAVKTVTVGNALEFLDEATVAKRGNTGKTTMSLAKKSFGNEGLHYDSIAFDIGDITDRNDWIAIVHADGNGLGQVVATKNKKPGELRAFSEKLDKATIKAAQQAHNDITTAPGYHSANNVIPFRPVVLGGDDMTIICRADLALPYVTSYIRHFEENTKVNGDPLTACAGIAYMKSSYPFHYGYRLAEALCEEAKKDSKLPLHMGYTGKAPSSIMFHKIQGSYIGSFGQIEQYELTINSGHSLKFGPYYLAHVPSLSGRPDRWTVKELMDSVALLKGKEGNAAKSDIRQWLTLMHDNVYNAEQKANRVNAIASDSIKKAFNAATTPVERDNKKVFPAYDMLQLLSVEAQITK